MESTTMSSERRAASAWRALHLGSALVAIVGRFGMSLVIVTRPERPASSGATCAGSGAPRVHAASSGSSPKKNPRTLRPGGWGCSATLLRFRHLGQREGAALVGVGE